MKLVLGLIMLRVSIILRVEVAHVRLPLIISLPPKKTAPVFRTELVCIIFLSAFGDLMQTKNNGFGWRSVIILCSFLSFFFFSSLHLLKTVIITTNKVFAAFQSANRFKEDNGIIKKTKSTFKSTLWISFRLDRLLLSYLCFVEYFSLEHSPSKSKSGRFGCLDDVAFILENRFRFATLSLREGLLVSHFYCAGLILMT